MYTRHFNLDEPPFSIAPNPRYLYLSPQHREALAHLLYGIGVGGGFVALTGEVGTGKTTLCRCLLEQLPDDVDIALIFNPRLNSRELLASVCDELHVANPGARASLKQLIDLLNHHLLDAHARGRRTIVLIDEAQNLSFDVLEQIRLLTNLETNQAKLLQIILVGQPELNTLLARPNLRQLSQRITARYHLKPLSLRETGDYIRHRLAVAGGRERIFTGLAIRAIFRKSGGIPRLINLIADRALLGAYTLGRDRVSWRVARKAARELLPTARSGRSRGWTSVLLLASAGAAAYFAFSPAPPRFGRHESVALAEKPGTGPAQPPPTREPAAEGRSVLPSPSGRRWAEGPDEGETPVRQAPATVEAAALPRLPAPGVADARPAPALAERLAGSEMSREAVFARLLSLWRLPAPGAGRDACAYAAQRGLHCLTLRGPWSRLRSLNHPAVLEFQLANGDRRYAALVRMRDGKAELVLGEATSAFDPEEILSLWKGVAVLLWKPPGGWTWPVAPGERSESVRWVRQRLGLAAGPGREDLFDTALKARVIAFQAERGLSPDGVVGAQTMIYLGMTAEDPGEPRLEPALH